MKILFSSAYFYGNVEIEFDGDDMLILSAYDADMKSEACPEMLEKIGNDRRFKAAVSEKLIFESSKADEIRFESSKEWLDS